MKKLFTLVALLTCFLGAKAALIEDAYVDFSKYSDISEWGFPYSWGGSDQARERLSIVDGCLHFESSEVTKNDNGEEVGWLCQFFPIGGVDAEVDVTYTLHFKIKGDHVGNVSMLGFGQTPYGQFQITDQWVEGTVDYVATNNDGNILMQCGDWIGTWDIAYLKITHEGKVERPAEWIEALTNGDAETPWADPNVRFNDQEKNYLICAWGKEKGVNMNENDGWDPFPATIEPEEGNESNHVFVVHGKLADSKDPDFAWDNQFWIESPKQLKVGSQFKLSFRYKASKAVTTNTQFHHQNPSDYVHWQAIGDISFTTEWQTYDGVVTVPDAATDAWSVAFNLNPNDQEPIDFFFDDISLSFMKLDEGWFVAGSNTETGLEYDFDTATQLVYDDDLAAWVAKVGTEGNQDSWVNELMISTVRGNDRAFKSGTIKPSGIIDGSEDTWLNYTDGSNAKVKLPAAGVWQVAVDDENKQVNFYQIEGDAIQAIEPEDIITNATEVIVKGLEREPTAAEQPKDEEAGIAEGTGQPWDNQFFLVANRNLEKGEVTVVRFKYKSSIPAHTTTQLHGNPGGYLHWAAIGDVDFDVDWQDFEYELTVPSEADGMKSIAFNMAEIKEACDYELKDFQWYLKYDEDETKTLENLIDAEGTANLFVKEGAGTNPYEFGTQQGISSAVYNNAIPTVIYNLAGQRVANSYKGIVVKNGRKAIVK